MYPCFASSSSIFSSVQLLPVNRSIPCLLRHRRALDRNLLFLDKRISFDRIATYNSLALTVSATSPSPASSQPLEEEEQLPPKLREIVRLFQSVGEPKAKYEQLLFYGKNLKPLDEVHKTRKNKVEGCVSRVWLRAYLDSEKNVVFEADSDSALTKGLAALLVIGLSRRPAEEIVRVSPKFVVMLGLQQSLTPSRNNGFLNMVKLMKRKALELIAEAENVGVGSSFKSESGFGEEIGANSEANSSAGEEVVLGTSSWSEFMENLKAKRCDNVEISDLGGKLWKRRMRIIEMLEKGLNPVELEVEDVSHQHVKHAGARGIDDNETHFNVKIVSKEFEGKSLVKRHRLVYSLLQDDLLNGLHALSIVTKTPSEVDRR